MGIDREKNGCLFPSKAAGTAQVAAWGRRAASRRPAGGEVITLYGLPPYLFLGSLDASLLLEGGGNELWHPLRLRYSAWLASARFRREIDFCCWAV